MAGTRKVQQAAARTEPLHRADGGRGDAPPTNRASHTCNGGGFKALRWGVDSLYLSYYGELSAGTEAHLAAMKDLAQSPEEYERARAQYPISGHIFEVKDKGAPHFPFVIEDNCFRIQLSRSKAKSLPMGYAKVSSDYLAHVGPREAERALTELMRQFGALAGEASVSRIDLFVDFLPGFDMNGWSREAFITRAKRLDNHFFEQDFSGWVVAQGSPLSARLYCKTLEMAVNRFRSHLPELWKAVGWDGEEPVWRLEFQVRREPLAQFGLRSFIQVMDSLNGIWSYSTTEWLRLAVPSDSERTRSRWPVHPLWQYLASVDWESSGGPLSRRFTAARVPGDAYLYTRGMGALLSFMAREGITDYDAGLSSYVKHLRSYHENLCFELIGVPFGQYIAEKVASRARDYNTIVNAERERLPGAPDGIDAERYRAASDGFNPYGEKG